MLTASVCRVWLRICNNVYDVVRCLMSPLTDRPQVIIHLPTVFRFVSMWNLMSSHLHQLSVLFCQSMSNLPHPLIDAQKHDTQQNQNVKLGYCEAQARVRQGSARDGPYGERPQSLNPCLELTLKLFATFPPTTTTHRKSHYSSLMAR